MMNILLERYRPYCYALSSELLEQVENTEITLDDLFSVAFTSVVTAARKCNVDKYDKSFYAYWVRIATNDINHYIKKVYQLMGRVSLDTTLDDGRSLHDIVGETQESVSEDSLFAEFMRIIEDETNDLNIKERTVLRYYLEGYEFKEIAELMQCSKSKIYYLYKTSIQKIRNIIAGSK